MCNALSLLVACAVVWCASCANAPRMRTDGSEKPVGEWDTMEIECRGRGIKLWGNGVLVNDGHDCTADRAQIALQAEGAPVEFKRLEPTPLEE